MFKLTDETIRIAVVFWFNDPDYCISKFGHISDWDTSEITDMSRLFYFRDNFDCDISKWNTENVVDMSEMFYFCSKFSCDISKWNTKSLVEVTSMLTKCDSYNHDMSNWSNSHLIKAKFNRLTNAPCYYIDD